MREIMNGELFALKPTESAEAALTYLLALGITGAPVLDEEGKPIGMISLRDLVRSGGGQAVGQRMSRPVSTVLEHETVEEAGRRLGESNRQRLIVVDADGRAVGNVSAIDVLRSLLGLPVRHPSATLRGDLEAGLSWSEDALLDMNHVELAPDAPGMLVLLHRDGGALERPVWAELTQNVRTRLLDMLSLPQEHPRLREILERQDLRFRASQPS